MNTSERTLRAMRLRSQGIELLQGIKRTVQQVLMLLGVFYIITIGMYGWWKGSQQLERQHVGMIFPECDRDTRVCLVRENGGGIIPKFLLAAHSLVRNGYRLKVDGTCASACALALDLVRKWSKDAVCITTNADFEFHKGVRTVSRRITEKVPVEESFQTFDPPDSPEVIAWVNSQGGFPDTMKPGVKMLKMPYQVAATFWKPCT